jgi:hypothetical protein
MITDNSRLGASEDGNSGAGSTLAVMINVDGRILQGCAFLARTTAEEQLLGWLMIERFDDQRNDGS